MLQGERRRKNDRNPLPLGKEEALPRRTICIVSRRAKILGRDEVNSIKAIYFQGMRQPDS